MKSGVWKVEREYKIQSSQTGGKRSIVDNVMVELAVIERNTYLNKTTYLTFADVQKCFDRLWLEDGIKDLWMCGVDIRDAVMILKLNETARITVDTPVGMTDEFEVKNIVKQGTVYAVDICCSVMDGINKTGHGIRTMYGPNLEINALAYIDDVTSAGSSTTCNNTIQSCNYMEKKKKIPFNTDIGKSAVMLSNKKKQNNSITKKVKKGRFEEVTGYQLLGVWIDGTAKYMINIKKNQSRIKFMINSVKAYANDHTMGCLAVSARIKMTEIGIIPAILHGVEAFPSLTKEEENELEKLQAKIIRDMMEVPQTTSYNALLLELGILTMKARVDYRKLMLYHNLSNSDDRRIAKNLIIEQKKMNRKGTWFNRVQEIMVEYEIDDNPQKVLKSGWKKNVKQKIREKTEEKLRKDGETLSKSRTALLEKYEMKEYLKETTTYQAKQILKSRLHMMKIPCNYKSNEGDGCWLCGHEDKIRTEHYYECKGTARLHRNWSAKIEDLTKMDTMALIRTSMFLEKVVEVFKPKWETKDD